MVYVASLRLSVKKIPAGEQTSGPLLIQYKTYKGTLSPDKNVLASSIASDPETGERTLSGIQLAEGIDFQVTHLSVNPLEHLLRDGAVEPSQGFDHLLAYMERGHELLVMSPSTPSKYASKDELDEYLSLAHDAVVPIIFSLKLPIMVVSYP